MRLPFFPVALLLGAVGASAQPVTDFRLPPDPDATPTSAPEAEGPTDVEGDRFSVPRVITSPTPTPGPTASPSPRATASPRPTQSAPASSPTPSRSLPASDRSVSTREMLDDGTPQSRSASQPRADAPTSQGAADSAAEPDTATSASRQTEGVQNDALPTGLPIGEESATASPAGSAGSSAAEPAAAGFSVGGFPWYWLAGALAALLALAGAIALLTRRKKAHRDTGQAEAGSADLSGPPLREVTAHSFFTKSDADSLEVEAHAVTLNRSVMNASISYRLSLVNRGREPITQIEVNGDVTTAHGQVPADQQLADPDQVLPELHSLPRLGPGERTVMQGELRLPLREVRAIRQGTVPVFVPLLRLTVRSADHKPRAFTYVIGTRNAQKGARPNPFRLDEPPRSYAQLTTRALA